MAHPQSTGQLRVWVPFLIFIRVNFHDHMVFLIRTSSISLIISFLSTPDVCTHRCHRMNVVFKAAADVIQVVRDRTPAPAPFVAEMKKFLTLPIMPLKDTIFLSFWGPEGGTRPLSLITVFGTLKLRYKKTLSVFDTSPSESGHVQISKSSNPMWQCDNKSNPIYAVLQNCIDFVHFLCIYMKVRSFLRPR